MDTDLIKKITKDLHKMYDEPKSLKFVLHLVHCYYPINKVTAISSFSSDIKRQCSLTYQPLTSEIEAARFGGSVAFKGHETNTMLCEEGVHALNQFVKQKLEASDKRIKFITKGN